MHARLCFAGRVFLFAHYRYQFMKRDAITTTEAHLRQLLSQRILISAMIAVPLDTLAFQYLAGYLTPAAFMTEVVSKGFGVLIVWYILRARDRKLRITTA